MTWADIWRHEGHIEPDLHQVYGLDFEAALDPRSGRTWRWLSVRILGLLSTDSRLRRALDSKPNQDTGGE